MRRVELLLLFFVTLGLLTMGQLWGKFGISKTYVTFFMHHPPAFVTPGRELRIEATSVDPRNVALASHAKALLERQLIRENFKPTPNAQTALQYTVNELSPRWNSKGAWNPSVFTLETTTPTTKKAMLRRCRIANSKNRR